jgi:hypothetical protein
MTADVMKVYVPWCTRSLCTHNPHIYILAGYNHYRQEADKEAENVVIMSTMLLGTNRNIYKVHDGIRNITTQFIIPDIS